VSVHGNWQRLLAPERVALVGASETKPAQRIAYENIVRHNFSGELLLVNPGHTELFGRQCIASLEDAAPVDVAMILVDRDKVLTAVESSIAAAAGAIIVVSGGFRETRDPHWQAVEEKMANLAASHDVPLIGPNCTGVTSMATNAMMSIAPYPWPILKGSTFLVMQSGGQLAASSRYLGYLGGGLRASISLGNAASVDFADVLEHLSHDPFTQEVVLLIEEIPDWHRFHDAACVLVEQGKWLGAVVVGRSAIGREAAATHTGSIAGDHRIMTSALAQCGIHVGRSLGTVITAAALQSRLGPTAVRGVGILGISGSSAGLAADLSYFQETHLPKVNDLARSELEAVAPGIGISNPLDIAGAPFMDPALLRSIGTAFMSDRGFDVNVYLPSHGIPDDGTSEHLAVLRELLEASTDVQKPLIVSQLMPVAIAEEIRHWMLTYPMVAFVPNLELALESMRVWADDPLSVLNVSYPTFVNDRKGSESPIEVTVQPYGEHELKQRLALHALTVPRSSFISDRNKTEAAIADLEETFHFPIVIKGVARTVIHKAKRGLVALDVRHPHMAIEIIDDMWQRVPELDGILLEEYAPAGIDILASVSRDQLGIVVALAEGGEAAYGERAVAWFAISPSTDEVGRGALHLLSELAPQIAAPATSTVVALIVALTSMFEDLELSQLEVNPFRLYPDSRGVVLDIVALKR
jgi:acetate---CoA ligase (ADP-forming)